MNSYLEIIEARLLLIVFFVLFAFIHTNAQKRSSANIDASEQSLFIFSDRNLYVVGELIQLKIVYLQKENTKNAFVNYVYCDLLGQDGSYVQTLKSKIVEASGQGQILIPKHLKSGNYLLKAYTRQLRNNPDNFAFLKIKIVNPLQSQIINQSKQNYVVLQPDSMLNCEGVLIDNQYFKSLSARKKVSLIIQIDTNEIISSSLSMSIVPKNSFWNEQLKASSNSGYSALKNTNYFQEKRGMILSGTIINQSNREPMVRSQVLINVLGYKDIFVAVSDSLGHFKMSLPDLVGLQDVYVCTSAPEDNALILIDKDYDLQTNYQFGDAFSLSEDEKKLALQLAQNQSILLLFNPQNINRTKEAVQYPFYQHADEIIIIDDYIDLEKLSMYFTELPGSVHLRKERDQIITRIDGEDGGILLQNPLIMIDYVAVVDIQTVLKINPQLIKQIEIVRSYYQKGDASFGGIINFISNHGDFGSYEFPKSSITIQYQFLSVSYKAEQFNNEANIPDARNTVLWDAEMEIQNSKLNLMFYTPETPGYYSMIIQGLDHAKNKVYKTFEFVVE